ncbi:hypothetical protein KKHLCK_08885 [Candidatus Electrothrix laxa]
MEPITTTIVAAIALGASHGLKDTAAEAVKDSWAAMKNFIQDRYKDNEDVTDAVDYAIKKPAAKSRQQELSKALENAGADKNQELVQLAEKLLAAAVKEQSGSEETVRHIVNQQVNGDDNIFSGTGNVTARR